MIWGRRRAGAEALRRLGARWKWLAQKYGFCRASVMAQRRPKDKQKRNLHGHETFSKTILFYPKSTENCIACRFSLRRVLVNFGRGSAPVPLCVQFCNSLPASKTEQVWSKTVFEQECFVLPHQSTNECVGVFAFVVFKSAFRKAVRHRGRSSL